MTMFYGEKLQSVRELNSLSRKELAEVIEVSEQAIWQYETGHTIPKFEIVNELKKSFSVKANFFYTVPFISKLSHVDDIAYRTADRNARKKAKMETTYVNFIHYFIETFEKQLDFPASTITLLRDETLSLYYKANDANNKKSLLENIAEIARIKLNVQDNRELLYKLELSGINVLEKSMGSSIDAYSTWINTEAAFIILGNERKSSVRRNFDLAHELGHLLLHYHIDMDALTKEEHRQIEIEADTFASFFLLPKGEFLHDFSSITKKSNPKSYVDLKLKYMVSINALEYRAYKLGLLTFEENRYFHATLNKYGFRVSEPLDDEIAIIKPGKIRALFDLVFKNKLLNLPDLLHHYQIDRSFLEKLFDFENDFLQKYDTNIENIYFSNEKVVPLFSERSEVIR